MDRTASFRNAIAMTWRVAAPLILVAVALVMGARDARHVFAAPPPNDAKTSAAPVDAIPFADAPNTVDATLDGGESTPSCFTPAYTVWYSFRPTVSGSYIADTIGSDHDTAIAVYDEYGAQLLCDDNSGGGGAAFLSAPALGSTQYFIQVSSSGGATGGNVSFHIDRKTFTVTSADDVVDMAGCTAVHCSLREAINAVNAGFQRVRIKFNIAPAGRKTIAPLSPLPALAVPVVINGLSQPLATGELRGRLPRIEISGASAGSAVAGLQVVNRTDLKGIAVTNWTGDGIRISGLGEPRARVTYTHIGVDMLGNTAAPNTGDGIEIQAGARSYIGRNIIGANGGYGIRISAGVTEPKITANTIGRGRLGESLPNGGGILLDGVPDALVRGNTIADNTGDGVRISGAGAIRNNIRDRNVITNNGALGIENVSGGNTEPLLAPPVIGSVGPAGVSGTACVGCYVHVYSDPGCEGRDYETTVYAAGGVWSTTDVVAGPNVTAKAQDALRNTSEFACLAVPSPDLMSLQPEIQMSMDNSGPGEASNMSLQVRVPAHSLVPRDLSLMMRGSEWFPDGIPAIDTIVGGLAFKLACTEVIDVSGADGPGSLIPLRMASAAEAAADLPPWVIGGLVFGAFKLDAADVHAYRPDASEIDIDLSGLGKAFVWDLGGGRSAIDFGAAGAQGVVPCLLPISMDLELFGEAGGKIIRRNASGPGLYGVVAGALSADNPEMPEPDPGQPLSQLFLGYDCFLVGYDEPYFGIDDEDLQTDVEAPPGLDDNGNCLRDGSVVTVPAMTGPFESSGNDGGPDTNDGDDIPTGIELLCNTSPFSSDGDADGVPDRDACALQISLSPVSDFDFDGVLNPFDRCIRIWDPSQLDTDNDTEGDACDWDDDGDGMFDRQEATFATVPILDNPLTIGIFENGWTCEYAGGFTGAQDPNDRDTDNDGESDGWEACNSDPTDSLSTTERLDGMDNDLDGKIDECAAQERIGFIIIGCTDSDTGGPDGLMDPASFGPYRGIGDEYAAGTCRRVGGPMLAVLPLSLTACTDSDSIYEDDWDNDSIPAYLDSDSDNDDFSDGDEARYGTNPRVKDTDGDGCLDGEEIGGNHVLGEQRDPMNFWDFYDVNGSKSVGLADALLILTHFGHAATGIDGAGANMADHNLLDRYIPVVANGWLSAEANNGVGLADALANLRSFGDTCSGAPN